MRPGTLRDPEIPYTRMSKLIRVRFATRKTLIAG